MTLVALACMVLGAPAKHESLPSVLEHENRFGWRHAGFALEGPMVGVLATAAPGQRSGVGYSLGAALSAEVWPRWVVRAYGVGGGSYGGSALLQYRDGAQARQENVDADWLGLNAGVGVTHVLRTQRDWAPFAGVDAGLAYHGFRYRLRGDLERLVAQTQPAGGSSCSLVNCPELLNEARAVGISAGVRIGVQFLLRRWLATEWEVALTYADMPQAPVGNTLSGLQVLGGGQATWLVRTHFSVKLGV